jgi:NADPH:quinone reductase-like Zn-dependent oxidoreductase
MVAFVEPVGLRAGETVLITGASGGVGSAAVQLAKRGGAVVIAVVSASKADEITSLGASKVVARQTELRAAVGSEAVDVAVDVAGGPRFPELLEALRRGGRGAIAGPNVELDLRTVYLKDVRLFGCTILEPRVFSNLVRYIERSEIKPVVSSTHPLSDIVLAQQEFLEKRDVGKIVLVPDP